MCQMQMDVRTQRQSHLMSSRDSRPCLKTSCSFLIRNSKERRKTTIRRTLHSLKPNTVKILLNFSTAPTQAIQFKESHRIKVLTQKRSRAISRQQRFVSRTTTSLKRERHLEIGVITSESENQVMEQSAVSNKTVSLAHNRIA